LAPAASGRRRRRDSEPGCSPSSSATPIIPAAGGQPVPIANVAVSHGVIVRMVRALHELYGVPFEHSRAYGIALGLTGGVLPHGSRPRPTTTAASFVPATI